MKKLIFIPLIFLAMLANAQPEPKGNEIVRSLLLRAQTLSQTQEDNFYKTVILDFEREIAAIDGRGVARNTPTVNGATKAVLQSLLADIYQQYEQNTRWKRRNITELDTLPKDISEWSSKQLWLKSAELYIATCKTPESRDLLKAEKTANWQNILASNEDIDLFPTLYDVLAFRVFNFLQNNNLDFLTEEIRSKSKKLNEQIISDLDDFHEHDMDLSASLNYALIHLEQGEIDFPDKAEAILNLAQSYKLEPFSACLYYRAAQIYADNGNKIRALEICQNVKYDPSNKWTENAKLMSEQIQRQIFTVEMDKAVLPGQPIALRVSTQNIDSVFYRIYKYRQFINKGWSRIDKEEGDVYKSGVLHMRHFDDFLEHSTIVKLDRLPAGYYNIEFSNNSGFEYLEANPVFDTDDIDFHVNTWIWLRLGKLQFQLMDRKTGRPVNNKTITLYNDDDDENRKISLRTDAHGIFSVPNDDDSFHLYDPKAKTYSDLESTDYWNDDDDDEEENQLSMQFFTDGAIYRPSQTVYFKGILYSELKNKAEIVKNKTVNVELRDANNQKISGLELTTNDYGSIFGEFVLPNGGLTGNYRLVSDAGDGRQYFKVEEYKRPKFEVKMDSLRGEFTLEDEVKTTGKAESFAGAPVSDAKVVYRVERQEIYPFWHGWYPPQHAKNETITQGETTTGENGKFSISFTAKPQTAKKAGEYRTYRYKIVADVTDINGETHSTEQTVTVGDLPRKLTLNVPKQSLQKDFKLKISSANLNNVPENSKGQIIVTQLIAPDRIILPNKAGAVNPEYYNYDQAIDYQLYDYQTFIKYFPHLPYSSDEANPQNWKHGKIWNCEFDTEKSETVDVETKNFSPLPKGYYLVEAFSLFGKDTIQTAQMVEILDDKTLKSTDNNFFSVQLEKPVYQVGETVNISLLSDWKNATAVLHIESGGKWTDHKEIAIRNGKGTYSITATEKHLRDGFFVTAWLLMENGYSAQSFQIPVMDKPHDLKISTKTFRNKILPGIPETWELTISGNDKDKIAAEVLAAMYDASLDQFASNHFIFNPSAHSPYGRLYNKFYHFFRQDYETERIFLTSGAKPPKYILPVFPDLQTFKTSETDKRLMTGSLSGVLMEASTTVRIRGAASMNESASPLYAIDGLIVDDISQISAGEIAEQQIVPRKNLRETAFFYPNLYTDEKGDVKLQFTSPESLTRWKLLILAHTQDLHIGAAEFYTQTQKELMVVPNVPRFLREDDEVVISAKINNLSGLELGGNANLFITNALSGESIFRTDVADTIYFFRITEGKNADISWKIKIPKNIQAIEYKIVAGASRPGQSFFPAFSDGEQGVIPVLPNRMLVTETMPIFAKEGQTKTFTMKKLANFTNVGARHALPLQDLQNFNLTLEVTTNPLWLAVMSLPYLREYPYECSEQIFSRLYGNALSTYILNQNPKIKRVFDAWNTNVGTRHALPLQDNPELKNILLEETPWVREAQNETEQRKRLALMFDLNKMSQELSATQQKLIQRQHADGGFPWFEGGVSSVYITEHIVLGFGQLDKSIYYSKNNYFNKNLNRLIEKAILYIDNEQVKEIKSREEKAKKSGGKVDGKNFIHYFYVRSHWDNEYPLPTETEKYLADINKNISEYLRNCDLQRKAMIATVLWKHNYWNSARLIINNLQETAIRSDELGMYWKDNRAGWLWYQSPVETQTKIIEAFQVIGNGYRGNEKLPNAPEADKKYDEDIEEMKIWLIKNRQTNAWNSTKATTDAVYALINLGKDWTNAEEGARVWIGNTEVSDTGYIKQSWNAGEITPEMGMVKVEKTSPGTMWGGLYWQYFENLDKITGADSNVKMEKSLFVKKNTDNGQRLTEVNENQSIKVGDLVTVRLVIHVDRDMQYIHIKDMRAAGFEPVNVMSGYKYQNGCAYYENTRDAATNFFFERMTKGTYVFEYDVRANNAGTFSNGIATLQNMYAPEMSCHSSGILVKIDAINYK